MERLSKLKAPAIAGVIKEKSTRSAVAEIKNCLYDGADMIDLHLSCLEDTSEESLKQLIGSSHLPVLALNYNSTYECEDAGFSEEERVELFLRAVKAGAAGIDMQGYTLDILSKNEFRGEDKYSFTKGNPKEVVTDEKIISKQCELIERVHSMGSEVLLSCHPDIVMSCDEVVDLALFLEKRNPDIIKIVTRADSDKDMLEAIKAMVILKKELKTPISYHANGKCGALTRVLNPALGGQIAFCIDRYSGNSTMEQIDLKTAKTVIDGLRKIM